MCFPACLRTNFAPHGRKSTSSRFMLDPTHFNVTFCLRIINKIQGRATTGSIVQTLIHRLQTKNMDVAVRGCCPKVIRKHILVRTHMHLRTRMRTHTPQTYKHAHAHAHTHAHPHTHTSLTYLWNGDCSAKSTSNDIQSHGEGGDSGWDWLN